MHHLVFVLKSFLHILSIIKKMPSCFQNKSESGLHLSKTRLLILADNLSTQ